MNATQKGKTMIVQHTVTDTFETAEQILEPGVYWIEIPDDYDPRLIESDDILHDPRIQIVDAGDDAVSP